jgi:hypothetical protein
VVIAFLTTFCFTVSRNKKEGGFLCSAKLLKAMFLPQQKKTLVPVAPAAQYWLTEAWLAHL